MHQIWVKCFQSNINLIKLHHNLNICFYLYYHCSCLLFLKKIEHFIQQIEKISKDFYLLSDGLENKTLSDLSTAEKSLCVGWVYLQGFVAVFQGFVWAVQAELGERKVQEERKQRRPDPLLLCFSLCLSVLQQHQCLLAKHWSQYKILYFWKRNIIHLLTVHILTNVLKNYRQSVPQ